MMLIIVHPTDTSYTWNFDKNPIPDYFQVVCSTSRYTNNLQVQS